MMLISFPEALGTDAEGRKQPRFSSPASFLKTSSFTLFYVAIILATFTQGCAGQTLDGDYFSVAECRRCVETYDDSVDYFPNKVAANFSSDWTVEYRNSYKIIENTQQLTGTSIYYAYLCGTPVPEIPANLDAVAIEIPIRNFMLTSATHAGFVEQLGQIESFTAYTSSGTYLQNLGLPCVEEHLDENKAVTLETFLFGDALNAFVTDLTTLGGDVAGEKLDVIFTDPFATSTYSAMGADVTDGAVIVEISETESNTVIQIAEWVEFVSLFFNKERLAQEHVAAEKALYDCHKDEVSTASPAASVVYVSDCFSGYSLGEPDTYYYELIADAHGAIFDGTDINAAYATNGYSLTDEEFYNYFDQSGNAVDIVIVPSFYCNMTAILSLDAFQSSKVFAFVDVNAQNRWFGSRMIMPDRMLQEFISMITPTGSDPDRIWFSQVQPDLSGADVVLPTNPTCSFKSTFDASVFSNSCGGFSAATQLNFENIDTTGFECAVARAASPASRAQLSMMQTILTIAALAFFTMA